MNKTIIININGVIFHIEEEAYEILKAYMTEVKGHFAPNSDQEEIVSDIENRIAEMAGELLENDKRQVLIMTDVLEITNRMGRVSEFEMEENPPVKTGENFGDHKLFRDTEDRILGGVCAGIGHYFSIEAKWVRLIFALSILLGGTGFVVYFIFWVVMPPAKTRSEKMAMKGEEINLHNIKKNFEEEFTAVKQNLHQAHKNAEPSLNRFAEFLEDVGSKLLHILGAIIKGLAKFAGFMIVIFGGAAMFALIALLLVALGLFADTDLTLFPLNVINPEYFTAIAVSAFVILLIPIIAILLFALRVLLNRKVVGRTTLFAMLFIWLTSVGFGIYYAAKVGAEFKREGSFTKTIQLPAKPAYYLNLNETPFQSDRSDSPYRLTDSSFRGTIIIDGEEGTIREPHRLELTIEKSGTEKPELIQTYIARGRNYEKALKNAGEIKYKVVITDSVISFPYPIHLPRNALWRNQEVKMVLRLPENTVVSFGPKMNRIVENINLWDCPEGNDPERSSTKWEMSAEGLKCSLLQNAEALPEKQVN